MFTAQVTNSTNQAHSISSFFEQTTPTTITQALKRDFRFLKRLFKCEDGVSTEGVYESEGESHVPKSRNPVTSKIKSSLHLSAVKCHLEKHLIQLAMILAPSQTSQLSKVLMKVFSTTRCLITEYTEFLEEEAGVSEIVFNKKMSLIIHHAIQDYIDPNQSHSVIFRLTVVLLMCELVKMNNSLKSMLEQSSGQIKKTFNSSNLLQKRSVGLLLKSSQSQHVETLITKNDLLQDKIESALNLLLNDLQNLGVKLTTLELNFPYQKDSKLQYKIRQCFKAQRKSEEKPEPDQPKKKGKSTPTTKSNQVIEKSLNIKSKAGTPTLQAMMPTKRTFQQLLGQTENNNKSATTADVTNDYQNTPKRESTEVFQAETSNKRRKLEDNPLQQKAIGFEVKKEQPDEVTLPKELSFENKMTFEIKEPSQEANKLITEMVEAHKDDNEFSFNESHAHKDEEPTPEKIEPKELQKEITDVSMAPGNLGSVQFQEVVGPTQGKNPSPVREPLPVKKPSPVGSQIQDILQMNQNENSFQSNSMSQMSQGSNYSQRASEIYSQINRRHNSRRRRLHRHGMNTYRNVKHFNGSQPSSLVGSRAGSLQGTPKQTPTKGDFAKSAVTMELFKQSLNKQSEQPSVTTFNTFGMDAKPSSVAAAFQSHVTPQVVSSMQKRVSKTLRKR